MKDFHACKKSKIAFQKTLHIYYVNWYIVLELVQCGYTIMVCDLCMDRIPFRP